MRNLVGAQFGDKFVIFVFYRDNSCRERLISSIGALSGRPLTDVKYRHPKQPTDFKPSLGHHIALKNESDNGTRPEPKPQSVLCVGCLFVAQCLQE